MQRRAATRVFGFFSDNLSLSSSHSSRYSNTCILTHSQKHTLVHNKYFTNTQLHLVIVAILVEIHKRVHIYKSIQQLGSSTTPSWKNFSRRHKIATQSFTTIIVYEYNKRKSGFFHLCLLKTNISFLSIKCLIMFTVQHMLTDPTDVYRILRKKSQFNLKLLA